MNCRRLLLIIPLFQLYVVDAARSAKDFHLPAETVPHREADIFGIKLVSDYAISAYESYLENKCNVCAHR